MLWKLAPDQLAKHVIGGLTVDEADIDVELWREKSLGAAAVEDRGHFILPPLPNTLFTRDSSCWIYGGVSINPMYWPARRLEA
jgi:arginine deiminase